MIKRRFLAMSLAMLTVISMAGCSKSSTASTVKDNDKSSANVTEATTAENKSLLTDHDSWLKQPMYRLAYTSKLPAMDAVFDGEDMGEGNDSSVYVGSIQKIPSAETEESKTKNDPYEMMYVSYASVAEKENCSKIGDYSSVEEFKKSMSENLMKIYSNAFAVSDVILTGILYLQKNRQRQKKSIIMMFVKHITQPLKQKVFLGM